MSNVKKNYVYQLMYQVLISILPFITSPYLARVLGADSIGIYTYTYSIVTYFALFAMLGIFDYGNRTISKAKDDPIMLSRAFTSLYILHVILSVIALLAYLCYLAFCINDNRLIANVQMYFLLAQLFDISWFFFGMEKFKLTVVRNCIIKILTVVLIFIFVNQKEDLWIYALIISIGQLLSALLLWPHLPKYVRFCKVSLKEIFAHIKPMIVLFFAVIANSVFSYMDKIMIGSMSSYEQLGLYDNSWKMIEFPVGFITALGTVMMPKISNLLINKNDIAINNYIYKSMRFSMLAASAIAFGIAAISKEFSVVFWGSAFEECSLIMSLLSVTIIIMSLNSVVRTQYLIPREYDKVYLLAVISGAIVNIGLNAVLIPKLGAPGASIATILSYLTICIIQCINVRRALPLGKYIVECLPYLIIGFFMYLIIRFAARYLRISILTLFIEIGIGVVSFTLMSLVYALTKKDVFIVDLISGIKIKIIE